MANKNEIFVADLHHSYEKGTEILHGVSAAFSPGKITALIGANGCGKSTLLNLMAGVMKPDSGTITVGGEDIRLTDRKTLAKQLAVVHQNNIAPSDMTVEKLICAGRTPYREAFKPFGAADMEAVIQALKDTDTAYLADRPIFSLSGGQMQRVWLAMALAQKADILLLDEITTYLDVHYQLQLLHLISELNRKNGLTVITVLHDINLAFSFCQEVVVMKQGSVLAQGSIDTAVTEQVLNTAFDVSSKIISVDGEKHCIFKRKETIHE